MENCMDFRIFQRGEDGYARVSLTGDLPDTDRDVRAVEASVVREDDNLTILCRLKGTADGKHWKIDAAIPEGGLYRIDIAGPRGILKRYYHIGVGDVYVTCGQSNMTGYGRDNAYDPPVLGVHMLANSGKWAIAAHPLASPMDSIFAFPENDTGTSPALSFARRLKERLGVPIGIVPTAVGGTKLDRWAPDEIGDCAAEMFRRLELIGEFKGFLWYQGCSDAYENDAPSYYERFCRMIAAWRERYGHHPVLTVQLNRWMGLRGEDHSRWWGLVRDAQRRAGLELDDVVTVPSLDLPLTDGIHNSSGANVIIGERLANAACHYIYRRPDGQAVPNVMGAERIDDAHLFLRVTPGLDIRTLDNRAEGMAVEDETGLIECCEAIPDGDRLILTTARPYSLPAVFHYAWGNRSILFPARDFHDMPLLACYGVEIKDL